MRFLLHAVKGFFADDLRVPGKTVRRHAKEAHRTPGGIGERRARNTKFLYGRIVHIVHPLLLVLAHIRGRGPYGVFFGREVRALFVKIGVYIRREFAFWCIF